MTFDYYIPTKILFGAGKLNQLAEEPLPGTKALIVISNGTAMRKFGYLDRLIALLKVQSVESVVYDKILPNPIIEHVMEGAAVAKENQCDFVIGLGGGSSIDAAKSIAIMAKNPGDYWDYINGGTGKALPVENGALPIVAVTTTAGTGTEADPWTVITNGEEKNIVLTKGQPAVEISHTARLELPRSKAIFTAKESGKIKVDGDDYTVISIDTKARAVVIRRDRDGVKLSITSDLAQTLQTTISTRTED